MQNDSEAYDGQWSDYHRPDRFFQNKNFIYSELRRYCGHRAPDVMMQRIERAIRTGIDPFILRIKLLNYWWDEVDKHQGMTYLDFLRYMHHEDEKLIEENEQWGRERYKEKWGIV